jgi:hypothetical protein
MSTLNVDTIANTAGTVSIPLPSVEIKRESYVSLGNWTAGLTITDFDQTFTYNGIIYRPKATTVLPYTTAVVNTDLNYFTQLASAGPYVFPEDFGAVGDGVTDDRTALLAAFTAAGTKGATVVLRKRYLVDSGDLTLPENLRLEGTFSPYGILPWQTTTEVHALNSTIILNPSYRIVFVAGGQLHNLSVIRKGLTVAEATTANFTGTALYGQGLYGGVYPNEHDGIVLSHLQVIGFNTLGYFDMCPRMEIEYVSGDNINGFNFGTVYDVQRLKNCHMWPYSTIGAGASGTNLNRGGIAYYFRLRNDIMQMEGCFSYGYYRGVVFDDGIGTGTMVNCAFDNTGANTQSGSIGVLIEGTSTYSNFIGVIAYGNDHGFWITAAATDNLVFDNCRAVGNLTNAVHIERGGIRWVNGTLAGSVNGVTITGASSRLDISQTSFTDMSSTNILASNSAQVYPSNNKYNNTAGIGGFVIPTVASADPLVLPMSSDVVAVSGSTGFGNLNYGWAGRVVTLFFTGSVTVFNGTTGVVSVMHLNGATSFNAVANNTLTLMHNGSYWVEIARSLNS